MKLSRDTCVIILVVFLGLVSTNKVFAVDEYYYDAASRLNEINYDDGQNVQFSYDSLGNLQSKVVIGAAAPEPDTPPLILAGPFLVTGSWPLLPATPTNAFSLAQNYYVLWTFKDDYLSCAELCSHTAEYKTIGESIWTELTVNVDLTGRWYAYVELPIEDLQTETIYAFRFSVTDCAGQITQSINNYYFKVEY